ncbi:unnamed protein product [Cutaneotrichosporon oleaginosum]
MKEKPASINHNDVVTTPTSPATPVSVVQPDNASTRTITGSTTPRSWELFQQFIESVPVTTADFRNFARFAPLVSAILAPVSTLFDIPALTPVKDPKACLALSGIGLAFNVVGNVLLVLRFSSPHRRSKAVSYSLYCWVAKTIIAIVNIAYFGAWRNKNPDYTFDQAFWAGVVSVIIAGIISTCLFLHYVFAYKHDHAESPKLLVTGRKFMLSITGLFVLIGFQALAFSRLEGWKYFDGIYFSMQTTLTVGYGDLSPTTTWGKILCFPFAVLTIAQLANQVSIIIDFIKDRATTRRDQWRKRYSIAMHRAALQVKPYGTLIDEICLIHQIELHQQSLIQLYDLIWSFSGLIVFYVVGAACFNAMEYWGYGNAIYAVVILSTSIGFGDYAPTSAGGRVFWVIYALMCVPIITSFATNTVTGIMYTISEHKYQQSGFRLARDEDPEAFAPHSHFILKNHEKWDGARKRYQAKLALRKKALSQGVELSRQQEQLITRLLQDPTTHDVVVEALGGVDKTELEKYRDLIGADAPENSSEGTRVSESPQPTRTSEGNDGGMKPDESVKPKLQIDTFTDKAGHTSDTDDLMPDKPEAGIEFKLCKALIDRVSHLEAQSRQMLVDTMDENLARTVLLADRNLQVRDALHLYDFGIDLQGNYRAEAERAWKEAVAKHGLGDASTADQDDMLARVRRYRDTFAEILVLSSTLLQLQGDDLKRFERWRTGDLHHAVKVGKAVKGAIKGVKNRPQYKQHRKKRLRHHRHREDHASEILSESEAEIERDLCPPGEAEPRHHHRRRRQNSSSPRRSTTPMSNGEAPKPSSPTRTRAPEVHEGEPGPHENARVALGSSNPHEPHPHAEHMWHTEPCDEPDASRSSSPEPTSARPPPRRLTSTPVTPPPEPRSPFSAHPATSPTTHWRKPGKKEKRFVDVMARSVLKAADREATQAREGWMDWLADKAYDVISDAGHRVHVRHHRSASGRMGWTVRGQSEESGGESEGRGRDPRPAGQSADREHEGRDEREENESESEEERPRMRGGGERERAGGGSAAWVGGAGEGGGEESARVRAKEKRKRRLAQEARRSERRDRERDVRADSSDEERQKDSHGRQRMTLREHVADVVHEAKERHAENKSIKAEQAMRYDAMRAPDPNTVPLREAVEPPVTASSVA